MQLRKAEPLRLLDHHQRGIRHVDPHFDDRRRDQQLGIAAGEPLHRSVLQFGGELTVDHHNILSEPFAQSGVARFGGGDLFRSVALAYHRADPIGLPPFRDLRSEAIDQQAGLVLPHDDRIDRLATGRKLVQFADVQLAILRQRQRARDRRGGHG